MSEFDDNLRRLFADAEETLPATDFLERVAGRMRQARRRRAIRQAVLSRHRADALCRGGLARRRKSRGRVVAGSGRCADLPGGLGLLSRGRSMGLAPRSQVVPRH
jgi:hypothetical protein